MERVEKTVFLSYRRTKFPWALAIYQDLYHHGYDVFFDFNGIASGDFEQVILGNIKARAHFLVVLTPYALKTCDDPKDWLRREIETALEEHRNIVPLMLEGFDFDAPRIANQLRGKLAALKRYNGLRVPADFFAAAMKRLRKEYLNVPLHGVLHPAPASAQQAARSEQAAARAAPAVTERELTAQEWFERGLNATDVDEKLRLYGEAIRLQPDYADAFNNRGLARSEKGDLEGALRDFNKAVRLKPDDAVGLSNRGATRQAKGDLEGALRDFNKAIRLEPNFATAFLNRGLVRCAKGDLEGELQDYDEAIRLKPDYAEAFNNRGLARHDKGDLEGALQDYNQAIRLTHADAFKNRGLARKAQGDLEGAQQDLDEAVRLRSERKK